MAQPVFYDPRRSRWKRLRTLLDIIGVVLTGVIVVFVYTAIRSEPLPKPFLQFQKHPYRALKESEREKARDASHPPANQDFPLATGIECR